MGAVVFSNEGRLLFPFSRFNNNLQRASSAILTTTYPGANTNTSGGLYRARVDLFNTRSGDRPNVPNLAIVITDGKSTFDSGRTIPYAEDLRQDGVDIIAVGITNSVDERELRGIASPPQRRNENYFTSPDFRQLDGIIDSILSSTCMVMTRPPPVTPPSRKLNVFSLTHATVLFA